ncbi:hypothetical protein Tco_0072069 [Tanacetum coccineum]
MSGTIPPPPGASFRHTRNLNRPVTSSGNDGNPNMVEDIFQTNSTNNTGTNNVAPNVVNEDLPQLLDYRGCSHVINVPPFDIDDFTSWKDRRLANQDKRLKTLSSRLPNDVMKFVIKCATAKFMWNDLILSHEGPSDIRDIKIAALRLKLNAFKALKCEKVKETFTRLKFLLNELENKDVKISQAKVNATFVKSLPKKWLSMNQTQRANNSIKNDTLATLYGKYNYKEELIDQIYESETKRFTIQSSTSKALISNTCFQESDSDVEQDTRSSNEFLADLNA